MKRKLSIISICILMISLVSCGSAESGSDHNNNVNNNEAGDVSYDKQAYDKISDFEYLNQSYSIYCKNPDDKKLFFYQFMYGKITQTALVQYNYLSEYKYNSSIEASLLESYYLNISSNISLMEYRYGFTFSIEKNGQIVSFQEQIENEENNELDLFLLEQYISTILVNNNTSKSIYIDIPIKTFVKTIDENNNTKDFDSTVISFDNFLRKYNIIKK